jgi:histone acetyltransferase (RNA polymerase elongator complex component)
VGFFDGMEEGTLRANVIEARINDVSVRYERMKPGEESENEVYGVGEVVPAEKIINAAGFKVRKYIMYQLEGSFFRGMQKLAGTYFSLFLQMVQLCCISLSL